MSYIAEQDRDELDRLESGFRDGYSYVKSIKGTPYQAKEFLATGLATASEATRETGSGLASGAALIAITKSKALFRKGVKRATGQTEEEAEAADEPIQMGEIGEIADTEPAGAVVANPAFDASAADTFDLATASGAEISARAATLGIDEGDAQAMIAAGLRPAPPAPSALGARGPGSAGGGDATAADAGRADAQADVDDIWRQLLPDDPTPAPRPPPIRTGPRGPGSTRGADTGQAEQNINDAAADAPPPRPSAGGEAAPQRANPDVPDDPAAAGGDDALAEQTEGTLSRGLQRLRNFVKWGKDAEEGDAETGAEESPVGLAGAAVVGLGLIFAGIELHRKEKKIEARVDHQRQLKAAQQQDQYDTHVSVVATPTSFFQQQGAGT